MITMSCEQCHYNICGKCTYGCEWGKYKECKKKNCPFADVRERKIEEAMKVMQEFLYDAHYDGVEMDKEQEEAWDVLQENV